MLEIGLCLEFKILTTESGNKTYTLKTQNVLIDIVRKQRHSIVNY